MDSRDAKTLKGLVSEYIKAYQENLALDEKLVSDLRTYLVISSERERLQKNLQEVNGAIYAALTEAWESALPCEQLIIQKKPIGHKISQALASLDTADTLIRRQRRKNTPGIGPNGLVGYLVEFLEEIEKKADPHAIDLVKARILRILDRAQSRANDLAILKHKLTVRVSAPIRLKLGLLSIRKPKIRHTFTVDGSAVYLDIFFDNHLTNRGMQQRIENLFSRILDLVDSIDVHATNPYVIKLRMLMHRKLHQFREMSLQELGAFWLNQLKELFVTLITKNKDLIQTRSVRIQLKVMDNTGHIAYCRGETTLDHYLLVLDLSALIVYSLVTETFHDEISQQALGWFRGSLLHANPVITPKTQFASDPLYIFFYNLLQDSVPYGSVSLYNTFAHELQHAIDRKNIDRMNKISMLFIELMQESRFYENHRSLNLGSELISLMEFIDHCRTEAPTQLREFIVKGKSDFSSMTPIPLDLKRDLIDRTNFLISNLGARHDDRSMIRREFISIQKLTYSVSHGMNMCILLSDFHQRSQDAIILTAENMQKLGNRFPMFHQLIGAPLLTQPAAASTPEWLLARAMQQGNTLYIKKALVDNNIMPVTAEQVTDFVHKNSTLFLFRPSSTTMQTTLAKIEASSAITYYQMYQKACDVLKMKDRFMTPLMIKSFAEKFYEAAQKANMRSGFLP